VRARRSVRYVVACSDGRVALTIGRGAQNGQCNKATWASSVVEEHVNDGGVQATHSGVGGVSGGIHRQHRDMHRGCARTNRVRDGVGKRVVSIVQPTRCVRDDPSGQVSTGRAMQGRRYNCQRQQRVLRGGCGVVVGGEVGRSGFPIDVVAEHVDRNSNGLRGCQTFCKYPIKQVRHTTNHT
jgi:hypothetical protein